MGSIPTMIYSGVLQKQQYDAQAEQLNADAAAAAANGRLEAERIRKQAVVVKSSAQAAAATNGLNVNEGVSTVINDQITQDSEYDAWLSILGGKDRGARLQADAKASKQAGRSALTIATLNAMNDGAKSLAGGWK
jgi:hypothetical protein